MPSSTLSATAQWIIPYGYSLMFLAMLLEGPVVTAAGAFIAVLGYFDIWAVLGLSILANLIPDAVYYALGFWGRRKLIDKYSHYFGLKKDDLAKAERIIEKHSGKSLVAIKLIPFLATPGLILAGATKIKLKKYIFWSVAVTVPSSVLYLVIGYYFGAAYDRITHYLDIGGYLIFAAIVIFIIIGYLQKKFSKRIAEKLEQD